MHGLSLNVLSCIGPGYGAQGLMSAYFWGHLLNVGKFFSQKLHCVVYNNSANNSESGNIFISLKRLKKVRMSPIK